MEIKGLYKLTRADEEKLIQTFMDAFQNYPKLMAAFPDQETRLAAVEATLRYYTAYDMEYGDAFSLDQQIKDGVCVVHSDEMRYTPERHEKAGSNGPAFTAAMARLTEEEQQKWNHVFDELDELEKEIDLPEPHLYVDFLGVQEACQHQGRGRKLMKAVCEYAESLGLPLMLFTNTEEDVAFYKSLGFQVAGIVRSEKFGFVNTYLVKEAQGHGA
ncbi:MAG: GNAT family N-acetyltransferase [Firmicutes bacterium]|nr:GNAT family N-acetyltransferase [Bacillota bacterium]NBI62427.1 N-acetyltransferase [Clostridiales bacterium]